MQGSYTGHCSFSVCKELHCILLDSQYFKLWLKLISLSLLLYFHGLAPCKCEDSGILATNLELNLSLLSSYQLILANSLMV